ncbi:MAG: hypothetical protein ACFB3T_00110 [Geminicoccaceae bacterium]
MHDIDGSAGGIGHNHAKRPAQWQNLHDPAGADGEPPISDANKDLDLVEAAFIEGFAACSDPTSFLRLAGIPFDAVDAHGRQLKLLRVEHSLIADVASVTPVLGGGLRHAPLPARLVSKRPSLTFHYLHDSHVVALSFADARALTPAKPTTAAPSPKSARL